MECFIYTKMDGTGDKSVMWNKPSQAKPSQSTTFSLICEDSKKKTQGHKSKKVTTRKVDGET